MERHELAARLGASPTSRTSRVLIVESNPEKFMAAFAKAVAGRNEIFLGNPDWSHDQRAGVEELLARGSPATGDSESGWLMIPTGGSSGQIKFARHDSHSLAAAVGGFTRHFGLDRVNAAGGLPLYHVSGLMGWLRSALTGGIFLPASWAEIEAGLRPELPPKPDGWVISLVPTQLARLLREGAGGWLAQFRLVLLGGAPAWPDLLDRAAEARVRIALSYGMTETAAMVTALAPEAFLAGVRSAGTPLPHARIDFDAEGIIHVTSEANFTGYYPARLPRQSRFATADLGTMNADGLHVTGRRDAVIITGGEKVQPADVESVLKAATGVAELAVLGLPDAEWGQRVVAVFSRGSGFSAERAAAACAAQLAPHQRPKNYVGLPEWPAVSAGKLDRARLTALALAELRTGGADGPR